MLPKSLGGSWLSARQWLALAAGIGCGACGYAGLYPRFDDGNLRIILALTSIPFGAAVVAAGASARTAARAFGLTLLLSAILGMASTVIPAAMLVNNHRSGEFFLACFFGAFFGAPTGAFYGIPLGILAALGHAHVRASTHEGRDRAARVAGTWLVPLGMIGVAGTFLLDVPKMDYALETMVAPSRAPAAIAVAASLAGALMVANAWFRLRRRTSWIDRVRSGLEPEFRLRPIHSCDRADALPRFGDGTTVVEWLPEEGSAYRMAASGIAVALVCDEHPIRI